MPASILSSPAQLRPTRRLPSFNDGGAAQSGLSRAQRRIVVLTIACLHVLAGWALLQVDAVRQAAEQVAPMLVSWLPAPTPPEAALPKPEPPKPVPKPKVVPAPRPPVVTSTTPATPDSMVTLPPPEVVPLPAPPPLPVAQSTAPAEAAAPPPPAPRTLPDAAVQYLEPPQVEYPRISQRRAETGLVLVRAYIGIAGGAPRSVQVERSSGHARLDQAAVAAVQKARFKPYAERGQPVEGWALIPIRFELEK